MQNTTEYKTAYISSKIEPSLRERLNNAAELLGKKPSTINRIALEAYLETLPLEKAA